MSRTRICSHEPRVYAYGQLRCEICDKQRFEKRRLEQSSMVATYKLMMGCIDCGYDESPFALDLDHVRGKKVRSVSSLVCGSLAKLLTEMDKCEVRCANCHRIKTEVNRPMVV